MPDEYGLCHNCGKRGDHWVPRYEGVPGYYVCKPMGAVTERDSAPGRDRHRDPSKSRHSGRDGL